MLPPALSSYHQWAKTPGLNSSCFHLLQATAIEQLRTFLQFLIFLATTSPTLNFGSFRLYLTFSSSLRKRKPALFQKDFLVPSECYFLLYIASSSLQQPPTNSYSVKIPPAIANCSSIQQAEAYFCFIELIQAISTYQV